MKRFLQLHVLTPYAPSNLNRDDLGKPKSALFGGANRLRISSQCLKRTWRTSEVFDSQMKDFLGIRTKHIGAQIKEELSNNGIEEKKAFDIAKAIASKYGKLKKDSVLIEQLAHISPEEKTTIEEILSEIKKGNNPETENILTKALSGVDIALFGRMLAEAPEYNIEAAAQVAHAITTHRVAEETDFFTAVDDLNKEFNETGSGYLGEFEFGSGLFYHYICINREQLVKNLGDNVDLAKKSIEALTEAITTTSPGGKQNSFAALARAAYVLAETGNQQPRSLSMAFFNPIKHDFLNESIKALKQCLSNMNEVYGPQADSSYEMLCSTDSTAGSLKALKEFVKE